MVQPKWLSAVTVMFVILGCGDSKPTSGPIDAPAEYHFLKTNSLSSVEAEEARESLPYDEIQFERTPCYGTCPVFVVTLRRDGSATLVGRSHVEHIGKFSGSVSLSDYGKLCWAIEKFELARVDSSKLVSNTVDHPSTSLRLKSKKTSSIMEIWEDGLPGPVELWVVQNSIDKLVHEISWHPSLDSVVRTPNSKTLIEEALSITLVTPKSSELTERIRVVVSDASRDDLLKAVNNLVIKNVGIPMSDAADMRAMDVSLLIVDDCGYEHSVSLYWGDSNSGIIVYQDFVYDVSAGLTKLQQLIANNSGLPKFGNLQSNGQAKK